MSEDIGIQEYSYVITIFQRKSYRMEFKSLSPDVDVHNMAMKFIDSIKQGNNNCLIKDEILWNAYYDYTHIDHKKIQ